MKYFLLSVALGLSTLVQAQQTIHTVKDANAEKRKVGSFTSIQVDGGIDVYITQGSETGVAVSASSEEYREAIVTEVRGNTLYVAFKYKYSWHNRMANPKAKAYVSVDKLESVNVSGACDLVVAGVLKSDDLKVVLSGASNLKGELQLNNSQFSLTGASDCRLTGKAERIKVQASGASSFKGYDLNASEADINASGASDVQMSISNSITVEASGASSVHYKGEPRLKGIRVTGASSFSRKS
ncbi:MAG: head GIN domain-containing protein [Bacteroidota bacterium]